MVKVYVFFFFQAEDGIRDVAVTGVQTCALPISGFCLHDELEEMTRAGLSPLQAIQTATINPAKFLGREKMQGTRSEEHTSELQSRLHLVCRLLLEKKKHVLA